MQFDASDQIRLDTLRQLVAACIHIDYRLNFTLMLQIVVCSDACNQLQPATQHYMQLRAAAADKTQLQPAALHLLHGTSFA